MMQKQKIDWQGQSVWAWVLKQKKSLWLHVCGKTYYYKEVSASRSRSEASIAKNEIHAPMPGKILKVHYQVGDKVVAGQVAIVMEAMKMEYSLEVGVSGQVSHLNCQEGDQVSKDQLLLQVQE